MKYSEQQVLDILKLTTENPEQILEQWEESQDKIPLDLSKYDYPLFVFTFPIIVNNETVAEVTLIQLYGVGDENTEQMLMTKYFTPKIYKKTHQSFSHDTYLHMYLHIKKEFKLPKIKKGFFAYDSTFTDNKNQTIKYTISYGYPINEKDEYIYHQYTSDNGEFNTYRFSNTDINIQIEKKPIKGNSLGETINKTLKMRKKT